MTNNLESFKCLDMYEKYITQHQTENLIYERERDEAYKHLHTHNSFCDTQNSTEEQKHLCSPHRSSRLGFLFSLYQ